MVFKGQASLDYFLLQIFLFSLIVGGFAVLVSYFDSDRDDVDVAVLEDFVDEVESFGVNAFSREVGSRIKLDLPLSVDLLNVSHPVNGSGAVVEDSLFFVSEFGSFRAYFDFPVFFYFSVDDLAGGGEGVFFEPFLDNSSDPSVKFLLISLEDVCPAASFPDAGSCLDTSDSITFLGDCSGVSRPVGEFDRGSTSLDSWFSVRDRDKVSGGMANSFGTSSCFLKDFNGDCRVNSLDFNFYRDNGGCSQ